jgi:uncharacterized membrane protein
MPEVSVQLDIEAPMDRVWETVVDVERYPASMETVRWVRVLDEERGGERRTGWSVDLKGSILEWEEVEQLDREAGEMRFEQLRGDLLEFDGAWVLEKRGPNLTRVSFDVSFEIGIPLLADMLNPVAQRSLADNCVEMLRGVEREAVGA